MTAATLQLLTNQTAYSLARDTLGHDPALAIGRYLANSTLGRLLPARARRLFGDEGRGGLLALIDAGLVEYAHDGWCLNDRGLGWVTERDGWYV